jgi:hypothetical protein
MKTRYHDSHPGTEDYQRLQLFARTFQHEIAPQTGCKTVVLEREDKVFGYADIFYLPVVFPAFHPAITTPRAVVETLHGWQAHCDLNSGGAGFIAVPLEDQRQTFPRKMMEGMGFKRMQRELYQLGGK